ncbi:hypothetical protein pipiens_004456 [Culex pipiens pipiens]|uniref:C2H2-type domain-containing protein n=1 Tax=Culex pipiens pipiens TaxID=38569 RepID=A0ABD1CIP8_CULPP
MPVKMDSNPAIGTVVEMLTKLILQPDKPASSVRSAAASVNNNHNPTTKPTKVKKQPPQPNPQKKNIYKEARIARKQKNATATTSNVSAQSKPSENVAHQNSNRRPGTNTMDEFLSKKHKKSSNLKLQRKATAVRVAKPLGGSVRVSCPICQLPFGTKRELRAHLSGDHGAVFSLKPMLNLHDRNGLLKRQVFKVQLQQIPRAVPMFEVQITNATNVVLVLRSVFVFDGNECLHSLFGETVLRMAPGYCFEEQVTLDDLVLSGARTYSLLIVATPWVEVEADFQIVEQFHFREAGQSRARRTEIKLAKLPDFPVPVAVRFLYKNKFKNRGAFTPAQADLLAEIESFKEPNSLSGDRYHRQLTLLNQIEDEYKIQEFRSYIIMEPKLNKTKFPKYFTISINQFKARPSMLKEDVVVLLAIEIGERMETFEGVVERIDFEGVLMLFEHGLPLGNPDANFHKLEFIPDRSPFQLEYQALELLESRAMQQLAFPSDFGRSKLPAINEFKWIRQNVASNEEQMAAVRNIVNQSSFPAPYILFGPPGTGKTSTLAEAIGQIYHQRPKENVLVAATSNFAANELTNRLLGVVPDEAIFRFFSKSCTRKVDEFDNEVLEVSNLNGRIYQRLCYEDIYQSRVVVCTLATAGRLNQARIAAKHFSYVFIDECGSAKEISALIPIAGIATFGSEVTASVVLAGDPRQLGPVIMYDYLSHSSQSRSMLDRLIDHGLYAKSPGTGEYNRQVITQLRDNFRSHTAILQYSNKTFYEARLRAKASPEVSGWALGWSVLPNQNFPIIFHPLVGKSLQDKNSTSLYNEVEADQVMWYIRKILAEGINGREFKQTDIGVISPYALQVAHLKSRFREPKWADIEIGSVEQYQGREKPIIIVSTVRTRTKCVGFLSDVKRLNVTLTRAQALMIIVGDPSTLGNDPHWKEFIKYCRVNRALVKPTAPAIAPANQANKKKQKPKEKPPKQAEKKKPNVVKKVAPIPAKPVPVNNNARKIEEALSSYLWFRQQLHAIANVELLEKF